MWRTLPSVLPWPTRAIKPLGDLLDIWYRMSLQEVASQWTETQQDTSCKGLNTFLPAQTTCVVRFGGSPHKVSARNAVQHLVAVRTRCPHVMLFNIWWQSAQGVRTSDTFKRNTRTCYQQAEEWHNVWAVASISKLRNSGASEQRRCGQSLLLFSRENRKDVWETVSIGFCFPFEV